MLRKLRISNFAIIENVELEFQNNLTTITGETGSGKSILLGALNLLLGERADYSVLRDKNSKTIIEGEWHINEELRHFFEENDLEKTEVFKSFNDTLHQVLEICSGLQFFNNFQNHHAIKELEELGVFAYVYADLLFMHALQKQEIVEELKLRNPSGLPSENARQEIIELMKVFIGCSLTL
jgi:predicted ATP-dependent endonuclease of OLD family